MVRHYTLLTLSMLLSLMRLYSQQAKDQFVLIGKIKGLENGIIYLSYYNDELQSGKKDSSLIKKGLFSFSGNIKGPAVGFISLDRERVDGFNATNIFLEPGKLKVEITLNEFRKAHLTGSATQNDYEELIAKEDRIVRNHPFLFDSSGYILKDADDNLSERLAPVLDSINRVSYKYFDQHPASYLTAYLLQYQARHLTQDSLALFYNRLGEELKNHVVTQTIRLRLKNKKVATIGTMAPVFLQKTGMVMIFIRTL